MYHSIDADFCETNRICSFSFLQIFSYTDPRDGTVAAVDVWCSELGYCSVRLSWLELSNVAAVRSILGHRTNGRRRVCRFHENPSDVVR